MKIGHIFVIDIEFTAFEDPKLKIYNEFYPCIFEPKTNIPADYRSVYQLLANMKQKKIY